MNALICKRASAACVLLALALAAAGCRRSDRSKDWLSVHPTSGTVTLKGKPAEGAKIIFHPLRPADGKTAYPFARVGADGAFRLTTYASNDGAPAGEYAVTVVWPAPPDNPDDEPFGGPDQLKGAYANPKKPLLKATVKEGDNPLPPFEITTR